MNAHQRRKQLRHIGTMLRRAYPVGLIVEAKDYAPQAKWHIGHVECHARHGVRVNFGNWPHPVFVGNPANIRDTMGSMW